LQKSDNLPYAVATVPSTAHGTNIFTALSSLHNTWQIVLFPIPGGP